MKIEKLANGNVAIIKNGNITNVFPSGMYLHLSAQQEDALIISNHPNPYPESNGFPIHTNSVTETIIEDVSTPFSGDTNTLMDLLSNSFFSLAASTAGSGSSNNTNYLQALSVLSKSETAGIYRLDARNSQLDDNIIGAANGQHFWTFQRITNNVNILGNTSPIQINEGANVTVNAVEVEKNITGNSWNSSFYSTQSFNPLLENFAVSWLIEDVSGTIREMGGFDNAPTQNNSYTSLEYGVYQVNNSFYSSVYENGAATPIPNYSSFIFQVGDRVGIKCINQTVSYFVLRNGIETIIYISTKKATEPLFFKGAFNRGVGSSGHSKIGAVAWHIDSTTASNTIEINGDSADIITSEDIEKLQAIGLEISPTCKYCDLLYTPINGSKYNDDTGNLYPLDVTHKFIASAGQTTDTVTFV